MYWHWFQINELHYHTYKTRHLSPVDVKSAVSNVNHEHWSYVTVFHASYPNITACQIMTLLSRGDPCTPEGGSCWSLLKSLINRFLAAVDMIPQVLPIKWRQFCLAIRLVSFEKFPSPINTSGLSGKSTVFAIYFVNVREKVPEVTLMPVHSRKFYLALCDEMMRMRWNEEWFLILKATKITAEAADRYQAMFIKLDADCEILDANQFLQQLN